MPSDIETTQHLLTAAIEALTETRRRFAEGKIDQARASLLAANGMLPPIFNAFELGSFFNWGGPSSDEVDARILLVAVAGSKVENFRDAVTALRNLLFPEDPADLTWLRYRRPKDDNDAPGTAWSVLSDLAVDWSRDLMRAGLVSSLDGAYRLPPAGYRVSALALHTVAEGLADTFIERLSFDEERMLREWEVDKPQGYRDDWYTSAVHGCVMIVGHELLTQGYVLNQFGQLVRKKLLEQNAL